MPLDYTPLRVAEGQPRPDMTAFAAPLSHDDLRAELDHLYDAIRAIVAAASDAEIAFVPHDPHAHDPYASADEQHIGWTLGHLVAHVTATMEETFCFSSILARGIAIGGRIRSEVPWTQIDTTAKALARLDESRRICHGYLSAWPDAPDLSAQRAFSERAAAFFGPVNAKASAVMGLSHTQEHIAQFEEVARQARAATQTHA